MEETLNVSDLNLAFHNDVAPFVNLDKSLEKSPQEYHAQIKKKFIKDLLNNPENFKLTIKYNWNMQRLFDLLHDSKYQDLIINKILSIPLLLIEIFGKSEKLEILFAMTPKEYHPKIKACFIENVVKNTENFKSVFEGDFDYNLLKILSFFPEDKNFIMEKILSQFRIFQRISSTPLMKGYWNPNPLKKIIETLGEFPQYKEIFRVNFSLFKAIHKTPNLCNLMTIHKKIEDGIKNNIIKTDFLQLCFNFLDSFLNSDEKYSIRYAEVLNNIEILHKYLYTRLISIQKSESEPTPFSNNPIQNNILIEKTKIYFWKSKQEPTEQDTDTIEMVNLTLQKNSTIKN